MTKNGSKWRTMPKLMLAYRAAAFFGRLYAPELLLGIHSDDELNDIAPSIPSAPKIIEPDGDIPPIIEVETKQEAEPEEIEVEVITDKAPETVEEKVAAIIEPEKKPQQPAQEKKAPAAAAKAPFMFNFEE